MSKYDDPKYLKAIKTWKRAAKKLEDIRQEDIINADTIKAMKVLGGAIDSAIINSTPSKSSGLVIQQKWFKLFNS